MRKEDREGCRSGAYLESRSPEICEPWRDVCFFYRWTLLHRKLDSKCVILAPSSLH